MEGAVGARGLARMIPRVIGGKAAGQVVAPRFDAGALNGTPTAISAGRSIWETKVRNGVKLAELLICRGA